MVAHPKQNQRYKGAKYKYTLNLHPALCSQAFEGTVLEENAQLTMFCHTVTVLALGRGQSATSGEKPVTQTGGFPHLPLGRTRLKSHAEQTQPPRDLPRELIKDGSPHPADGPFGMFAAEELRSTMDYQL